MPVRAWHAAAAAILLTSAVLAPGVAFGLAGLRGLPDGARYAQSTSVDDHAALHLVKASQATLIEEGAASGTLPGHARVRLVVGSNVQASFTITLRGGSIEGRGGASLHSSSRYASFGGWLSVAGGSGSYAHAHGGGRLYGVLDRRTHALTVQTSGTLTY